MTKTQETKYAKVMLKDIQGIISVQTDKASMTDLLRASKTTPNEVVELNGLNSETISLCCSDIKGFITGPDVDVACETELENIIFNNAEQARQRKAMNEARANAAKAANTPAPAAPAPAVSAA